MNKRWLQIAGLAFLVIYFICVCIFFSGETENRACVRIEVNVKDSSKVCFVSNREVAEFLENNNMNPVGLRYKNINTDKIEKELLKMPRIKSAQCYKTPSGTIKIDILQREPILRVLLNGHSGYYIDIDGKIMPTSNNFTAFVPIATGDVTRSLAKNELYEFAKFLKKNKFWDSQIEQIDVKGDNIRLIPRVGNHIIDLGTLENFEEKLENLMAVYKTGFGNEGWNAYKYISLKYDGQVVCTKKTN